MYLAIFVRPPTKLLMERLEALDCQVWKRDPYDATNRHVLDRRYVLCEDEAALEWLCKRHKGVMMGERSGVPSHFHEMIKIK